MTKRSKTADEPSQSPEDAGESFAEHLLEQVDAEIDPDDMGALDAIEFLESLHGNLAYALRSRIDALKQDQRMT